MTILFILSSILFMLSIHPLSMCFLLITSILMSSVNSWKTMNSFLPNYLIIMVYVGGMMILFIYVSSLIPNKMSSTYPIKLSMMILIPLLTLYPMINQSSILFSVDAMWTLNPEILLLLTSLLIIVLLLIIYMSLNPKLPMKTS